MDGTGAATDSSDPGVRGHLPTNGWDICLRLFCLLLVAQLFQLLLPTRIHAKGQLISKEIFGGFNSSKKTNFIFLIFALAYCSRNFLLVFLEELKNLKSRFEIN